MSRKSELELLEDIAQRCFEAEATGGIGQFEDRWFRPAFSGIMGCGSAAMALAFGATGVVGLLVFVSSSCLAWLTMKLTSDPDPFGRRVSRRLKAFRAGDPEAVLRVHEFAVKFFREKIESHRARTLGNDSEWGKARTQLSRALDEARGSVAYWRLRSQEDDGADFAGRQRDVAVRLEDKLGEALGKLDTRADVLLQFYRDCEARLAVMDRYNRDSVETRRLENLSDRADVVIAEAEETLAVIGRQFVAEARRVGRALAGLADTQVLSLAGEAPLNDLESLADRIIERSDSDKRAIRELDASLGRGT